MSYLSKRKAGRVTAPAGSNRFLKSNSKLVAIRGFSKSKTTLPVVVVDIKESAGTESYVRVEATTTPSGTAPVLVSDRNVEVSVHPAFIICDCFVCS